MSKATITIEDGADGNLQVGFSVDNPGKTFEQIKAQPTSAEAAAFAVMSILGGVFSMAGKMEDDDGSVRRVTQDDFANAE